MVVEGETTAEADYCLCPSPKTRLQVETNNNTCPTCQKMLIEEPEPKIEPKYEAIPALEGTEDENKDNKQLLNGPPIAYKNDKISIKIIYQNLQTATCQKAQVSTSKKFFADIIVVKKF